MSADTNGNVYLEAALAETAARLAAKRAAAIDSLRQLAGFLEANPSIELPYEMGGAVFVELYEARAAMQAAPGGWSKDATDNYWAYERTMPGNVKYTMYVNRADICRKVKIGTMHVEAVPEHDEPIYKWDCAPVDELDVQAEG
jgi:hypothetical protein